MRDIVPAAPAGQAAPSLSDLAAAIRIARADAAAAFSNGVERVREIGDKLKIAKKLTGHGRWGEFLKACDMNPRTAAQYMQLAGLTAKAVPGTDLAGMSIKAAIRHLSPLNSTKTAAPKPPAPASRKTKTSGRAGHAADIVSAWISAPPTEQSNAVDSIGLDAILAAIPTNWLPLLEARLAARRQSPPPPAITDDDLSIPGFLRREAPAKAVAVEG